MALFNFDKFKKNANKLSNKNRKGSKAAAGGVRVNRNVSDKVRAHRDSRARKRAEYLSTLPKHPVKRFFYYWHPKHFAEYWFNRDGAIRALKIAGVSLAVLMILMLAVFAYFRKDLPKNITDLKTCSKGASTLYYDRTGKTLLWASSGDAECYPAKLENISPYLQKSVVASEDKDYYKHGGFSFVGLSRAIVNNARGQSTQGGSTITQQFVKNSLLTQDQTITRKLKELILSIELERSYSKSEILNAYLNEIPFGSVYYGAEAASKGYFEKSAKDLTLDEAALLTAIIPAPTYYSPYGKHTEQLVARQHYILDEMVNQGYITKAEADAAKKVDTLSKISKNSNKYKDILAPHFVLEVQEKLEQTYTATIARKAGFKVITTLDLDLQKKLEDTVATAMPKLQRIGGDNMAAVLEDVDTAQVLALVGSRDFNYPGYGELDVANTPRSPGSSFKPYDYATLMAQNKDFGAGTTFYDVNTDFGGVPAYKPKDYDLREPGAMAMRAALGGSRNTPAIKANYIAGTQNVINQAKKMGLVSGTSCEPNCGLSSAIGDGSEVKLTEHVNAFSTFARMGKVKEQAYILKIEDKKGKIISEWKDTPGEQVLDPQIAYTINDMLSDSKASYFGNSYRLSNFRSALKTGTTNDRDNGWIMGYTPYFVLGFWSGNHENKSMSTFTENILGPAWQSMMKQAHEGKAARDWTKPSQMKTVCINTTTGYATSSGGKCDIFPDWYQAKYPNKTETAVIDSVSKKLATECTPDLAKQTVTGGGILSELPSSDPSYKRWMAPVSTRYGAGGGGAIPTEKDDVHKCDDVKPTVSLTVSPVVGSPGKYKLTATATAGTFPMSTVNFKIDGQILPGGSFDATSQSSPFEYTYTATEAGTKTIVVEVVDQGMYQGTDSTETTFSVTAVQRPNNTVASVTNLVSTAVKTKRKPVPTSN